MAVNNLFLLLSLIFLLTPQINGRSGGAPNDACEELLPRHGSNTPQNSPSPFLIKVNTTHVANGATIEIIVESDDPVKTFRGILLQAREDISVYETKGTFVPVADETKTITCQTEADTVTHISKDEKKRVKLYFTPPAEYTGVVTLIATVVEKFDTIYAKILSEKITVDNGQISTESPSTTLAPSENITFYEGCGTTKSCFGQPDNCIDRRSCNFATTVAKASNGSYIFELITYQREARYVALALSSIEFMSETTVMECVRESNRQIKKYDSWMQGRQNRGVTRQDVSQETTKTISTEIDDQMFICRLERRARTTVRGTTFDLDNIKYHLLLASGTQLTNDGIGEHDLGAKASESRLLGDIQAFGNSSTLLYRLHGVFMFVAWVGTTTIGTFLARYYKKQWQGRQFMNKDLWFVGHQITMTLTWLLTITGFIIIFVKIQAWSDTINPHPILGVITTALCFIQPIGAMFRPTPNHPNRRKFNWIHFLGGNTAHALGIISIFFAVSLSKASLPFEMYYVMVSFVVYYALAHVFCSIATEQENLKENQANGDITWWKSAFIVVHVIVVAVFTVIGVIFISNNGVTAEK